MTDPIETRRKLERLMKRVEQRDDYGRLLHDGEIHMKVSGVEDPDRWRAEIKSQAARDRIKIQTGLNGEMLWAEVQGSGEPQSDDVLRMNRVFQAVLPIAVEHRHEPKSLIRDRGEFALGCERCTALGYVDGTVEPPTAEGDLFEGDCPHEGPPKATPLTEVWGGMQELKELWEREGPPEAK